ncbi:hypothetical protein [Pseudoduganella albidiflava]|uniref:Uncharacterized protein n=1 Tax=Pseudoduganella albidiflava TaxID=321983 RepID=A0A411WZS6_9BURK|nr:hypothetical protein [Pseudoduganella albidiflava]QBI02247.1 hypothetical protein EYF70_16360 [Pseudoduganella albidiflava]GGY59370.1 hypothetical protein GCM10007387_47270 [Pseudoduganella albidiflava]
MQSNPVELPPATTAVLQRRAMLFLAGLLKGFRTIFRGRSEKSPSVTVAGTVLLSRPSQQAPTIGHIEFCLSEMEAQGYARFCAENGYVAIVEQDIYDFSWSVEVCAAPLESR